VKKSEAEAALITILLNFGLGLPAQAGASSKM
jgi:hypothetical protein